MFGTCPPMCVDMLTPMPVWVWRDVRFGFSFLFCNVRAVNGRTCMPPDTPPAVVGSWCTRCRGTQLQCSPRKDVLDPNKSVECAKPACGLGSPEPSESYSDIALPPKPAGKTVLFDMFEAVPLIRMQLAMAAAQIRAREQLQMLKLPVSMQLQDQPLPQPPNTIHNG